MAGSGGEVREIYHEVKNHMAVISSLLRLKTSMTPGGPAKEILEETGALVSPVVLVYQHLFQGVAGSSGNDLPGISAASFLLELADTLDQILACPALRIRTEVYPPEGRLVSAKAVPLGILVAELTVHRIRRGFPPAFSSLKDILISLKAEDKSWILEYRDNGSDAFENSGSPDTDGGLFLTDSLCGQLDGEKVSDNSREPHSGFVLRFRFPPELLQLPE